MEGWIKLHRQLQNSPLWLSEQFTRGQAWIDLLLLANHEYGFFYLREHKIEVNRGEVGWSELKLSLRWKWSRTKTRKFLNDLEKEQQIKVATSHSTTIITIINYTKYQEKEQQDGQQENNRKTTERQQKDTNKNEKKNKEKNIATTSDKIIFPNESEFVKVEPTWRDDFNVYKELARIEFDKAWNDEPFLKEMEYFYPALDIKKTLHMASKYWFSEDAWNKKRVSKIENINWRLTIANAFKVPSNKIYKDKQ